MKIVLDSSCGLSMQEARAQGYGYVPLQISLANKNYTEGVDLTADEFYALLAKGDMPHTAQPSPELYRAEFEEMSKDGDEVLLLSISSKVSGAFQAATIARQDCAHPEKIYLFDTLSFFGGIQILLQEAENHQNLPMNELLAYLEDLKNKIKVFAGMDTLEYVYKGGRLSKFNYSLGIFLHAKAIGTLDEGSVTLAGKALGTKNAMRFVIDKTKEFPIDFSYPCYLLYSSDPAILERFKEEYFLSEYPDKKDLPVIQIDPLIGSHIGPLVYGVFYVAKDKEEKPSLFKKIHEDLHHVFRKDEKK